MDIHFLQKIIFCSLLAKDDNKSPVTSGGGRISVTAPPSRKTSAANNVNIVSQTFLLSKYNPGLFSELQEQVQTIQPLHQHFGGRYANAQRFGSFSERGRN